MILINIILIKSYNIIIYSDLNYNEIKIGTFNGIITYLLIMILSQF